MDKLIIWSCFGLWYNRDRTLDCSTCIAMTGTIDFHVAPDTWWLCIWIHALCQVDQVPPNRTYKCSHTRLYGKALARSIGALSYSYHQRGEVMRARYPDQVGGDNLESRFDYMDPVPVWDNVVDHAMVSCHAMAGVWRTQGYRGHGYARWYGKGGMR